MDLLLCLHRIAKKMHSCVSVTHNTCVAGSLQTLCALFRGVHQKNKSASGFDIINMLMGFDKAEQRMKVRGAKNTPRGNKGVKGIIGVHYMSCNSGRT